MYLKRGSINKFYKATTAKKWAVDFNSILTWKSVVTPIEETFFFGRVIHSSKSVHMQWNLSHVCLTLALVAHEHYWRYLASVVCKSCAFCKWYSRFPEVRKATIHLVKNSRACCRSYTGYDFAFCPFNVFGFVNYNYFALRERNHLI